MATEEEITNLNPEWKSEILGKLMKNWQKNSQDRNQILSIQSSENLEKGGFQHSKKVQELMISYQKSLMKDESSSSHSTKSFSSHYNRVQVEEFEEMQMHLRDSVKNELLVKISNPCLLLRDWE